jgi:tRNA pseudouridine38-40 synthase
MPRYFLEVSYKGTHYSGFQSQHNANTIKAEVEKALSILIQLPGIELTGSSRTDAGVHALQNFFHFDAPSPMQQWRGIETENHFVYKINAILPNDIVVKRLVPVADDAHCRFDALNREYRYHIYHRKDPFLQEKAYYFPYKLDLEKMKAAASLLKEYTDFTSFSKRNTQVKTFTCNILESEWIIAGTELIYHVKANRFLRGMVRALTATMLKVGRNKMSLDELRSVIEAKDCTKASFAVPAHGLFLMSVEYPTGYFNK